MFSCCRGCEGTVQIFLQTMVFVHCAGIPADDGVCALIVHCAVNPHDCGVCARCRFSCRLWFFVNCAGIPVACVICAPCSLGIPSKGKCCEPCRSSC